MKKVLLTIISICLIAASVFGLFAGVNGVKDSLNIKEYKEHDAEEGLEQINDQLLPGIAKLKENEGKYTDGVSTYEAGLITYQNGQAELAAGGAKLAAARPQLAEGQANYDAGVAKLEEGKRKYAEGKAMIEANTAAYNEGKAMLEKIDPLMPYVNQYVAWRDSDNGSSNWPGFGTAQAWFMAIVRPIAAQIGLSIPNDVTDFPGYIQNMVAEGHAQMAVYEAGLAQLAAAEQEIAAGEAALAAGKATLDAGYAEYAKGQNDYAAGQARLSQGAQDLADGKAQLTEFEDGAAQVAAGLESLLSQPEYRNKEGNGDKVVCPSVRAICEERLGEDFTYWKLDDNGEVLVLNGCQFLDLDTAEQIAIAGRDYIEQYQTDAVTSEVIGRILVSACMLLASVAGILAGLFGLLCIGKISNGKIVTATVFGYIAAVLAIVGNIVGFIKGFTGYAFPTKVVTGETFEYVFTGKMQVTAIIILAVVAVIFVVIASIVRHAYKASKATVAAEAAAAAAVPATTPVVEAAPTTEE